VWSNILEGGSKLIHAIYNADTPLELLDSEDEDTTILQNITTHTQQNSVTLHKNLQLNRNYSLSDLITP
jgi:hypothetical protein